MARLVQWEQQIGRRVRLRDLFVFFTVVEYGSMAKAGAKLGVSTPSVSEVIAGLEHALGVRLLDRSPQGVVPTAYGEALLTRGRAAFDELRQGIRDIEFIADPEAGELRIGCPESLAAGFLVAVLERFLKDHPRVRFHVVPVRQPTTEFPELEGRKVDLVFARLARDPAQGRLTEDLDAEVLFKDQFFVVVGAGGKWARRRKVELADLVDERWIMTPFDALGETHFVRAFRACGLKLPTLVVTTFSVHLRNNLVANGDFITALPESVLRICRKRYALKELPIELSVRPPVAIVTLRNRTLGPVVQSFIASAREAAKSFAGPSGA
ncbi:MAG TPA: LysR family transcriptional regulator [Xanthobacteraceae bacterium]|jgi:DNA-binding transcriptional LysR family regulator|nr:LysR family transcriptional regulator [Xanthobacteraceae bacterium]